MWVDKNTFYIKIMWIIFFDRLPVKNIYKIHLYGYDVALALACGEVGIQ